MHEQIIKKLGAETRFFEEKKVSSLLQANITLATELSELLNHFKGAIIFTRGAKFQTQSKIPTRDKEGYIDLDIIYGLNTDSNNIFLKNETYTNQIDNNLYVFGESGSGDQYCLNKNTGEVYYWYHEAEHENETTFLIAPTFSDFITHLLPDDEDSSTDKKKKIVSAKFDF